MADIELVIKIPEDTYKRTKFYKEFRDLNDCVLVLKAIDYAIPLPKGHGRLIDADVLADGFEDNYEFCEEVNATPTIIEAEKKYETEVITRGNCMICGKELTEGLFFCKECEEKANSRK